MTGKCFTRRRLILLLPAVALVGSPALAADRFWTVPTDGELQDVTRWLPEAAALDPLDSLSIAMGNSVPSFTATLPIDASLNVLQLRLDTPQASVLALGNLKVANLYLYDGNFSGTATVRHELIIRGAGGTREFRALGDLLLNPASNVFAAPVDLFAGDSLRLRAGQVGGTNSVSLLTSDSRSFRNGGTLTLDAQPGTTAATTATIDLGGNSTSLTNTGTIHLAGGSIATSTLANRRVIDMPLANEAAGRVIVDARVSATAGPVVNNGLITVAAGGTFTATDYRHNAGAQLAVDAGGRFTVTNFEMLGSGVTGTISTQSLAIAAMDSASATVFREGGGIGIRKIAGATTGGDVPSGMTTHARATDTGSVGVGSTTGFTNRGRMILDAKPGTSTATTATLNAGFVSNAAGTSYTLNLITNEGAIDLAAGSSFSGTDAATVANQRVLNCRLLNTETGTLLIRSGVYAKSEDYSNGIASIESRGNVTLEPNSTFAPTSFRLTAGTLNIAPSATFIAKRLELVGGTINGSVELSPSSTVLAAADTFSQPLSLRPVNQLRLDPIAGIANSGNVPASIDLRVRAAQPLGGSTGVALFTGGRSFTNHGVITLDSAATTVFPTTVAIDVGTGFTFTNRGTLNLMGGSTTTFPSANTRAVRGHFINDANGIVKVDPGVRFEVMQGKFTNIGELSLSGAAVFNNTVENEGVIRINSGGSFNGRMSGSGQVVLNGGTLSPGGYHFIGALSTNGGDLAITANQDLLVNSLRARDVSFTTGSVLRFNSAFTNNAASRVERLLFGAGQTGSVDIVSVPLIVTGAGQYEALLAARVPTGTVGGGVRSGIVQFYPGLGLAIVRADDLFASGAGIYWGEAVSGDDAILRVTLRGDSDLDGTVNFSDLVRLAQNYNQTTGRTWVDGDSNHDGSVNFTDLVSLAQNYNRTWGPSPSANGYAVSSEAFATEWALAQQFASVPEPTGLAAVGLALLQFGRLRRRV